MAWGFKKRETTIKKLAIVIDNSHEKLKNLSLFLLIDLETIEAE